MNMAVRHASPVLMPYARTLDEVVKNLVTYGFTRYYHKSLPGRFPKVIKTFAELTQSPEVDLLSIDAERELHSDGKSNLGLRYVERGEIKSNPRPDEIAEGRVKYDETKFYFHTNQRTLGYLGAREGLVERHREFFLESTLMHSECVLLGHEIADRLDLMLPGFGFARRLLSCEDMAVLRLLRYLCDGDIPGIAQPHRDQNFLSTHIASDRPQLWLADRHANIIADAEETRDDSVLIFLSRKAWEITHGLLPGIVHGVLDPTFGEPNRPPRHTAVHFSHAQVHEAEQKWANDNIAALVFPQHLRQYAQMQAAA